MWTQADRDRDTRRRHKERELRLSILDQFPCLLCGESDRDLIDWHHVEPDNKSFPISRMANGHERWWDEVLKCIPLCVLCHRKIHTNKLCLIPNA